jgi:hypothetical protein
MLSQSFQFIFDAVRAAATDEPEARLKTVGRKPTVKIAIEAVKSAATELSAALRRSGEVHPKTAQDIQAVLIDSGIGTLLANVETIRTADEIVSLVLDRHRDVQQGKFDRGERKATWVRHDSGVGIVRLTAQRYQIPVSTRLDSWEYVPWHPYRTFGALRFISQCGIR